MKGVSRPPHTARVGPFRGRIALFLDGRPVAPIFYSLTDSPGGRWSWEELPRRNLELFARSGVGLFQLDLWLEQMWTAPGRLDISLAIRQIRGVLDVAADAVVVLRLHVNAPRWWCEKHPGECVGYADGPVDAVAPWGLRRPLEQDLERCRRQSLASEVWRRDAGAMVRQLCRRLARRAEGRALVGLHIADGVFGEWSYYGFIQHEPDTGEAMTRAFRRHLARKYGPDTAFAAASVPGMLERSRGGEGVFRDPVRDRVLIDYAECQHDEVADSILWFCGIVREAWPRPILVGVFYGYLYSMFGRQAAGGHLCIERVLESPDVDYLSAPQTYQPYSREVGGTGMSRGLLESCTLHGKLWLDEMDQPTHLGFVAEPSLHYTREQAAALLRRNVLHPLLRGHGLWYYDFGPRFAAGWWDDPVLMAEIARIGKIASDRRETVYQSPADVLMVCDTRILLHTSPGFVDDPVSEAALDRLAAVLYHSGAIFHMVNLCDLERVEWGRYRAVVFANTWLLSPRDRERIRDLAARDGRHLVFVYAPGYTDGSVLSHEAMGEVTGMRIERDEVEGPIHPLFRAADPGARDVEGAPGVSRKDQPGWTSWFFPLPPEDPGVLRRIFRESGAHVWCDAGDVIIAGWGLACVHTADGGRRDLVLPGGRRVSLALPPACTVLVDTASGELLIPP